MNKVNHCAEVQNAGVCEEQTVEGSFLQALGVL